MHVNTPSQHNVVTSLSITSCCMKTMSIPMLVRIYSVVTLNQDLSNKLEGTTTNKDNHSKEHYILHPYKCLPHHQTIAPDLGAVTCDNQPLHDSVSQHCHPSYLPHILHASTPLLKSGSVHTAGTNHVIYNKTKGHSSRGRRWQSWGCTRPVMASCQRH